jgi:hypothetical protein
MLQAERDGLRARRDEENIFRIAEWDTIYVQPVKSYFLISG